MEQWFIIELEYKTSVDSTQGYVWAKPSLLAGPFETKELAEFYNKHIHNNCGHVFQNTIPRPIIR